MTNTQNGDRPDKIGTAFESTAKLIALCLLVWILVQWIIYLIFDEFYTTPGTIAFIGLLIANLGHITVNVKLNKAVVLLDAFSESKRAVFAGIHFRLPWEKISYILDLESSIVSDIKETFPTSDGSIEATASVMSKIDARDSATLVEHVKFTHNAIKEMQEVRAKTKMREYFANTDSETARKAKSDEILQKSDFDDIAGTLKIKIVKCAVQDIDYNAETQKANNASFKSKTIAKMVNILITEGHYSEPEAKALAPLLDQDINLKKQINEINVTGMNMSPALTKLILNLAEKFSK